MQTRDRTCRFPHCGRPTGWADCDHVLAHAQGGPTSCATLCCLCRSHHRLKTHASGWRFAMDPDGTLHVTTPGGTTRAFSPPGRLENTGPPPDEPADDEPPPFWQVRLVVQREDARTGS